MQATVAAEKAAQSIADIQNVPEESESSKEEERTEKSAVKKVTEDDDDEKKRKSALEKLEKASEESLLGQVSWFFIFL